MRTNQAVESYTKAIEQNPIEGLHILYSNRSASLHGLQKFNEALEDADKCIELQKGWAKVLKLSVRIVIEGIFS